MLPGVYGVRRANDSGLAGLEGAQQVGDETVGGPVPAADHIAGAGAGNRNTVVGMVGGVEL